MECDPVDNIDVLYVALPPLSVPVPKVVVPSLNVTVPVAAEGVTVPVKVTNEPYVEGLTEEDTEVEVFVFANARPLKTAQRRLKTIV